MVASRCRLATNADKDIAYGTTGDGAATGYQVPVVTFPVGSWQAEHVPRLSNFNSRLESDRFGAAPVEFGYGKTDEYCPPICAFDPWATWHVVHGLLEVFEWRYV